MVYENLDWIQEIVTENKEFLERVIRYRGYFAAGALVLGAAILGVNVKGKDIPKLK